MFDLGRPQCREAQITLCRRIKLDFEVEKKYTNHTNTVHCLGWLEKHIQNPLRSARRNIFL